MCSKRCAKPVRPGPSCAGPTRYQRFTATMGSRRSCTRITCSPFFRVYLSNGMVGRSRAGAAGCAAVTARGVMNVRPAKTREVTRCLTCYPCSSPSPRHPCLVTPARSRQVARQPPLHFRDLHPLAPRVVLQLVAPDLPHREVLRGGMREVEAADRRRGIHRVALRETQTHAPGV